MSNLQKALNFCYFYLKFRPRTEKEIFDYLHKHAERFKFSEEDISQALERLKELKFVNDKDFTARYIEQRQRGKPKGKPVLVQELARKGVPKDIIQEFFEDNPQDEDTACFQVLERKWHSYQRFDPEIRQQKAMNFLLRRGFLYSSIKNAVARMENGG
jgi:regulatory protein